MVKGSTGFISVFVSSPKIAALSLSCATLIDHKPKAKRMVRYVRDNFSRPLATKLTSSGLTLDIETANAEVMKWPSAYS